MARTEFNWSTLDRRGLVNFLWLAYPEVVDRKMTPTQIHTILAKHVKQLLPVRVVKKFDPTVESGWIYVGGTYFSDYDQDYKKCIEVNFNYCLFDKKISLTKYKFERICRSFADVILHEIIHMRQYRRRKFKIIPDYESTADRYQQRIEQSYLGCPDEIDAYSFNMACELMANFRNDKKAVETYIGKKHRKGKLKSNVLRMYLKAFDYDQNHKIIRRLKKRSIGYINNAELGRPYKTSDWIAW